jgi:CelD/BcsL family acetyltransferase involved in cellulose biosynthesis
MTTPVAARAETADNRLSFRLLHSFADAKPLRSAWNELVLRSGADIYQTFDWCRLWWQYYGARRQLHLLLCFSGEELVGLVPGFIETLWLGPARLRVAKLVGADFTIQLCNLPILSGALPSVVSRAIHHFLGESRCDLLLFGPLCGPAARLDDLLAAGQHERDLVGRTDVLGDWCNTYFDLPDSFGAYLAVLDKKQRSNINRSSGQLSKAHRVSFDVVGSATKVGTEFERFCLLHCAQWEAAGKLGHFGDWAHAREFNRDLVRTLGDQGMVRFYLILADDQVVSSQFSFVFRGVIYWRLPARVCGPEWDKYGLGALGLVREVEAAIGEGLRVVEAGRGRYPYKILYGAHELPLRTVQFVRRGSGVSARVRCFRAFASLLNLAYYKVLVARLAPRVPALRRPLWPLWIRSTW